MEIRANDPNRKSFIEIPKDSDFSFQNLPFGIFKTSGREARAGVALGNKIIDLYALADLGYLQNEIPDKEVLRKLYLNDLMCLGKKGIRNLRNRISDLFEVNNTELQQHASHLENILVNRSEAEVLLPVYVRDYTDFYSSEQHAYNVGCMFRDPNNALLPNWKYIPVGYHGRASSIIPSGVPFHRPKGQQKPNENEPPVFGPCKLLDFELEMAFITFEGKPLGQSISTKEADDYIFGMVIFNDWSARDIQKWEYVPLGPFLAKNFASSISPWVVTLDALEPFRVPGPQQEPKVFPYLEYEGNKHIDIDLEVYIKPPGGEENKVCHSNFKYMYWNMNQQLAHHTVNGCNIGLADMMASGTISGPDPHQYGSMLELAWKGTKPLKLSDG
ncbi:MAG: fumarylacetoacetase, partial [Bacteroidetes bacterium]